MKFTEILFARLIGKLGDFGGECEYIKEQFRTNYVNEKDLTYMLIRINDFVDLPRLKMRKCSGDVKCNLLCTASYMSVLRRRETLHLLFLEERKKKTWM